MVKTIFLIKTIIALIFTLVLSSCENNVKSRKYHSFLNKPCMLVNKEQDNTIEGKYFITEQVKIADSSLIINIDQSFLINSQNCDSWILGWGSNTPNNDSGVENLREIKKVDSKNKKIYLGKLLKGLGFPEVDQRVVFWNTQPSGFIHYSNLPIINPKQWPEFSGLSIHFSSIVYDSISTKWYMIFNECDTSKIQIYAAMSKDLINWQPANNGAPILTAKNFEYCSWAGLSNDGLVKQTPYVSEIINYKNKWHLFMDGYDKFGKRHIGMAISKSSIIGEYQISKNPIISPTKQNSWSNTSCFYGKITKYKDGFIMFYDGKNKNGVENVGMASSNDLIHWNNYEKNPVINDHHGWRSKLDCSEPTFIENRHDSLFLLIAGSKKSKANFWHHYITQRMYLDVSGNVDDTQLGFFVSIDGGKTFIPHKNNPVLINDYSSFYENDHMGGNIKLIKTDSMDYLFYQAKSNHKPTRYSVLLRTRVFK